MAGNLFFPDHQWSMQIGLLSSSGNTLSTIIGIISELHAISNIRTCTGIFLSILIFLDKYVSDKNMHRRYKHLSWNQFQDQHVYGIGAYS